MTETAKDDMRERLDALIGKPISSGQPAKAPDPVNTAMIRHWAYALNDLNPAYLDPEFASASRYGGLVSPPVMLQSWTMAPPALEGIHERGGVPIVMKGENPLKCLTDAGYTGTIATNSEFEMERYPRVGDEITAETVFETISDEKKTAMGHGFFVTWITTYRDQNGEVIGRQRFRTLRFKTGGA
ncbi:MaoC family dehydratase N-terminal domain-containing protein [Mycobacterium sp. SMC-4]|uniref:MaoC family dehydratase N-terminal domain-containing protein n=1 Tax=Mycobacterium sp. SMC-4 TaxID=2857059 RepID=UPI0021B17E3A|nr:MaoC family dehydratase N-terminal domain-containing protein [Mycobacterium sp. SMC-4]UXA20075.1 MaoC family dehydratase N-terminal domain-containing protein [Mycobacterium sp. SMC-4]